jgi:WD repeat-containing protein 61
MQRTYGSDPKLVVSTEITLSSAHTDAIWAVAWTADDKAISLSVDGVIKQFDSSSGQAIQQNPPHTLGLISLSVSPSGRHALYNSIEGLTCLWDLEAGDIIGRHESYARNGPENAETGKPLPFANALILIASLAWSVSLSPKGATYASTGGSGNIVIHSAERDDFGTRRATLPTGKSKYGLFCAHVGSFALSRLPSMNPLFESHGMHSC